MTLRDSEAQQMAISDEFEEEREGFERMHGIDHAIAMIKEHVKKKGSIPRSLKNVLSQGVDAGLAKYKESMSGMALVSALFLVSSLEQTVTLPNVIAARMEVTNVTSFVQDGGTTAHVWDGVAITYYLFLILADISFFSCIVFYGHMTHYFTYMFHRDADLIIWLLEVDIERYFTWYSAGGMTFGSIFYCISVGFIVCLQFPWYVAGPPYAIGVLLCLNMAFGHSKLSTRSLDTFVKEHTDRDEAEQVDMLLRIFQRRADKWIRMKAKLIARNDVESLGV